MAIIYQYGRVVAMHDEAATPVSKNHRSVLEKLPNVALDEALIPAMRDAGVMSHFAQTCKKMHLAGMRTAVSNELKNIHRGVNFLKSQPKYGEDNSDTAVPRDAREAARTASTALRSFYNIIHLAQLRGGMLGPARSQFDSDISLEAAYEVIREGAHSALYEGYSFLDPRIRYEVGQRLKLASGLLEYEFIKMIDETLSAWTTQEEAQNGAPRTARDLIINGIATRTKSLDFDGLHLNSLPLLEDYIPDLEDLTLSNNAFIGIPEGVRGLNRLLTLNIGDTPIFSLDLAPSQLEKLKTLGMRNTQIPDSDPNLWKLTALENLDISSNAWRNLPKDIVKLTNLKDLEANECGLSHLPAELWTMKELKVLSLRFNELFASEIQAYKLPNLKHLYLGGNETLRSLPPHTEDMSNLETLSVWVCNIADLPADMRNLTSIKQLDLSHNKIARWPVSLQHLATLESLDLSNNPHLQSPEGLTTWTERSGLLLSTLIGRPAFVKDLSFWPALKRLDMEGWNVPFFPVEFCGIKELTHLNLTDSKIIKLPAQIGQFEKLEELNVSHSKLTYVPNELGRLKSLKVLNLAGNPIDSLPDTLRQLSSLETIDLSRTKIDAIFDWFFEMEELTSIKCENMDIKGSRVRISSVMDYWRRRHGTIIE